MKCAKCGQELSDGANFCRKCGSPTLKKISSLVENARENDQEALAEIYEISSPAIYRAIRIMVKDEDTVYDILQDTYVKAFTRLDQLQNPDRLIPWIKMIANNLAKDWLKKSKPVFFTDMAGGEDQDDLSFEESIEDERIDQNPEMAMDEKEVRRLVLEILDSLPEDQRMVIGMFYYEEMSVKDIAETLEISGNTVKSRLSYGRKKIKEQVLDLEKRGTKLYSLAPFVFFLYLLGKVDKVSAEPLAQKVLPDVMEAYSKQTSGHIPKQAGTGAVHSGSKIAGTAAGTAAKHAGLKITALILTGVLGAGGVTYGVAKHMDKLPFVQEQKTEPHKKAVKKIPTKAPEEKTIETPTPTVSPTFTPTPTPEIQQKKTGSTEYYATILHPQSDPDLTLPGTTQVDYNADEDTLTFYGTIAKSDQAFVPYNKEALSGYGMRTFQLTADTQYFYNEADDSVPGTKEDAIRTCTSLSGLQVYMEVTDGKVVRMAFSS